MNGNCRFVINRQLFWKLYRYIGII